MLMWGMADPSLYKHPSFGGHKEERCWEEVVMFFIDLANRDYSSSVRILILSTAFQH